MDSASRAAGKLFLKDYFPALHNGRNIQNIQYNPVYYPKQPGFKGKLYLLIDEEAASAASHLASLVKAYARPSFSDFMQNRDTQMEYVLRLIAEKS